MGSKRNLGYNVPMRLMLRGSSFSPLYWRSFHFALLDLVRQLGYPRVFWTLAPYEWSFPYHCWIRDEMGKLLKERLRLPLPETLHLAHVMLQTAKGLLLGDTGTRKEWSSHLFHVQDPDGCKVRVCGVVRLEFQDGSRKAATQGYHGSGRPHLHMLIFLAKEQLCELEVPRLVQATLPEEPDTLQGYVLGSQLDRRLDLRGEWVQESGQQPREGPTEWDEEKGIWQLQHRAADKQKGLRAFIPEVMDVLRCHQDFQFCDDDAMLRRYVTKYVSKFSDSASDEWLNDANDAVTIATNVLMRYHPMEPEMVLQLFGGRFRQWHISTLGGGKRDFNVPWPDKTPLPREIARYEAATWAAGRISLLDFLRKSNEAGDISQWLKKKHKDEAAEGMPLEDFAANFPMQGEAVVAAETLSRLSDRFWGQWLVLHIPFTCIDEFICEEALAKVPPEHRYLCMALCCPHPRAQALWEDEGQIRTELKAEAHTADHAETIVNMLRANTGLIRDYLNGKLTLSSPSPAAGVAPAGHVAPGRPPKWDSAQLRFQKVLDKHLDRALALQAATEEHVADDIRQAMLEDSKICVCLGPPGSGKTTLVHAAVERTLAAGGQVLFACPTAQLASRMRERYGDRLVVDTCHAAFHLNEDILVNASALDLYALVVVDEVSQIEGAHFERIVKLWEFVGKAPAVAVLGDKWQMPGMGETRAWETPLWKSKTHRTELHQMYRCRDPAFAEVLKCLRTGKPNAGMLRQLKRKLTWKAGKPTAAAMQKLLHAHPGTTILTCTRQGAAEVNQCALEALFPSFPPMTVLEGDLETNPVNYQDGTLKPPEALVPLPVPIHKTMWIYITKNIRKDMDLVNGMRARVVGYNEHTRGLRVETATGKVADVWRWTDVEKGSKTYYPIRLGYASTILKFQGAELDHVVAYLDAKKIPAAAYTAISRVHTMDEFRLAAPVPLEAVHFTPAR